MPVGTSQSIAAALRGLPPLVGLMVGLFSAYVLLVNRQLGLSVIIGAAVLPALVGHLLTRRPSAQAGDQASAAPRAADGGGDPGICSWRQ
ncbi:MULTISPECIES: hypothetical protein [Paracoccus]|uniref:hypothetical protein n=1 Tax=Paracoccus TaxID=265 RepID=UPI00086968FF|nr:MULTISPECIES: hypothetical protein [Paracoccus]ODT57699.1 MAG: hypothetical protein ABS73_15875 [Paracoccus sp. SCN 68-21]